MAKIEELLEGYKEFYHEYFESGDPLYQHLTEIGQFPKTLIIACSDSRVDPSIITNAEPGDIFVIRNVANLVPPYETDETTYHGVSAALEFAVCMLEVECIVVLGHSHCAGIKALLNSDKMHDTDFIKNWVNIGQKAKEKLLSNHPEKSTDELQDHCEQEGILLSLENLLTFPWIKSRTEAGTLKLHGWYFTIENGHLNQYDPEAKTFQKIAL